MRDLLPANTWYPYFFGMKPWGATNDFILRSPHVIPFFKNVVIDVNAHKAEENAYNICGWASSELIVEAHRVGIIRLENFQRKVTLAHATNPDLKRKVNKALSSAMKSNDVLPWVRKADNYLTGALAFSPKQQAIPYFYQASLDTPQPPWARKAQAWFEAYADDRLRPFPPIPKTKKWRELLSEIARRQKEPLNRLARLQVPQPEYCEEVHELHGDKDNEVDSYLRKDRKDGNYLDKFGYVVEMWRRHRDVADSLEPIYGMLFDDRISYAEFNTEVRKKILEDYGEYLSLKRQRGRNLKVAFTFAGAVNLVTLMDANVRSKPNFESLTKYLGPLAGAYGLLVTAWSGYRGLKDAAPFGYVKAALEKH
jgi:hypothetical protein